MRILWIGKDTPSLTGGEDVYDRKLLARLERVHDVVRFAPEPVGRAAKLANLACGVPLYRATYRSTGNLARLRSAMTEHAPDVVAVSWEPFDFLAAAVAQPVVLLLHNVTSDAVAEVFHHHPLARFYGARVRGWERRLYARPNVRALVTLSEHDARAARRLVTGKQVVVIAPGAPPLAPAPAAELRAELLISGTYDWYPKGRDLAAIAAAMAAVADFPLAACWDNPLPAGVASTIDGRQVDPAAWPPAIRYGLVPDTFASGFKLKVTYYVANNCVVLSRSPVDADYRGLPDQPLFMRRVDTPADMAAVHRELAAIDPADLARRFERFKQTAAERFSWDDGASRLATLLERAGAHDPSPF